MPDYNITLQFYDVTLAAAGVSASSIARSIEGLEGAEKLDALMLKNLPSAGAMTDQEIIDALNAYNGFSLIKETLIEVTRLGISLNYRETVNPYDTTWQDGFTCITFDFIIAVDVPDSFKHIINDNDWLIPKINILEAGTEVFDFSNTDRWLILKMSSIIDFKPPAFEINATANGVQFIGAACEADGDFALAVNESNRAQGIDSFAHGTFAHATRQGERAVASGAFYAQGDCQYKETPLRLKTTSNAATNVILPQPYTFGSDQKTYGLKVWVLARNADGTKCKSISQELIYSVDDQGNALSNLGPKTTLGIATSAIDTYLTVNGGSLYLYCYGLLNEDVYWNVFVETLEVKSS